MLGKLKGVKEFLFIINIFNNINKILINQIIIIVQKRFKANCKNKMVV